MWMDNLVDRRDGGHTIPCLSISIHLGEISMRSQGNLDEISMRSQWHLKEISLKTQWNPNEISIHLKEISMNSQSMLQMWCRTLSSQSTSTSPSAALRDRSEPLLSSSYSCYLKNIINYETNWFQVFSDDWFAVPYVMLTCQVKFVFISFIMCQVIIISLGCTSKNTYNTDKYDI